MKIIKFRAWDDYAKEWLLGYDKPNLGGFSMFGECILMGEWSEIVNRFILQQKDRKPVDLIVEQFTGVLDHLDREIYEGDRVYDPHAPRDERQLFVVKYDESMGRYWLDGEFPPDIHETDLVVYDNIHQKKPTKAV